MAKSKDVAADPVVEAVYPLKELLEVPEILGASVDIIDAAFRVRGVTQATMTEAKKIVKDFKERKVH